MPSYLTEYLRETQYERPWPDMTWVTKQAGPRIEADSGEEAARKLLVLIEFGMVHPKMKITGFIQETLDA